ncbi:hypothetical protein [Vagococcus sp. CY52-2]|uniref:hypothetical protein n=1 Tax=Vagococcus sp. CY52-2 TaxID=2925838 RepID=UPI001F56C4F0|nr:hypothetical protein [Vagococcus sp. CY52-2]UNM90588.1 hypothetical protein MN187_10485 [Vagococcus sp. CY52-2]UNM90642.1 hypothetical protein MN187_10185 [Vagococcus sp. CY52-2]
MAIYWDKDTLVLDDEFKRSRGLIKFELCSDNNVLIYQDSDIPVVRDKFEALDEYTQLTLDDTIESLLKIAHELEEYKNGESI